jgi:hypothetical protein
MSKGRADWAIVRAVKKRLASYQSVDPIRQKQEARKISVLPSIKGVLAAPIFNSDKTVWGVVDFDASTKIGCARLRTKAAHVALSNLAYHLSCLVAVQNLSDPTRMQFGGDR